MPKCKACGEHVDCPDCREAWENKQSNTLSAHYQMAREAFDEHLDYQDSAADRLAVVNDPADAVNEIADICVPVYTAGLLQLAANSPELAVDEPECGPAFDGTPTPTNIIAANVYEAIIADLHEYAGELKEAAEEAAEVAEMDLEEAADELAEAVYDGEGGMAFPTGPDAALSVLLHLNNHAHGLVPEGPPLEDSRTDRALRLWNSADGNEHVTEALRVYKERTE